MSASKANQELGAALKTHREKLGISVRTLASRADFSPSFISQVENGIASPSIGSLDKLASCLGVSLAALFDGIEQPEDSVVRATQRPRIESGWSRAKIESLRQDDGSDLEPLLITLQPGGASGRKLHRTQREQFIFVVSGNVELSLDGNEQRLAMGDALTVPSGAPVLWRNASERPVQLLFVSGRTRPQVPCEGTASDEK